MPELCTKCMASPIHPDSPAAYCKDCGRRVGHAYSYVVLIDKDKLRELVGGEVAARIIHECRSEDQ